MGDLYEAEDTVKFIPEEQYRPIMKKAMLALPELDETPHDLVKYLFSEDQRLWLKENLHS